MRPWQAVFDLNTRHFNDTSFNLSRIKEEIENREIVRYYFRKISAEKVHLWYPYKQFGPKNQDSAMKLSSNYVIFIVYQYA